MSKIKMKDFIKSVDVCDYIIIADGEWERDYSNVIYCGDSYKIPSDIVEKYFNRNVDMIYSSAEGLVIELS